MNPLISIIVPIYNSEMYIKRCVDSILKQTYGNIEVILVNDGSKDNSLKICEYFRNIDSRVKVINKENGGVSSARNAGIDIAKGEFLGFVDSDDFIDKNMYEELYKSIDDRTDLAALISYTINNTELLRKDSTSISGYEALEHIFKLQFPTSLWAYLYRRDAISNIRLCEDIHFFEDFEFNIRILINSNKVGICRNPLYQYEINEESINSQKINDKKISCLEIYNRVIGEHYVNKRLLLKRKAQYFRAHFLVSIILSLSKSLEYAEKKYFKIAKANAKKVLKDTLKSKYVPLKYKIVISITALSPLISTKTIHVLRNLGK